MEEMDKSWDVLFKRKEHYKELYQNKVSECDQKCKTIQSLEAAIQEKDEYITEAQPILLNYAPLLNNVTLLQNAFAAKNTPNSPQPETNNSNSIVAFSPKPVPPKPSSKADLKKILEMARNPGEVKKHIPSVIYFFANICPFCEFMKCDTCKFIIM